MIGLSRASFVTSRPERSIASAPGVVAAMTFTGRLNFGATHGETRVVTSLTVTNAADVARRVEVESEATKEKFSAVVQPGETVVVSVLPLEIYWNTVGPVGFAGRWDGLNVRWKEPA
jgi:hypothetical protein